MSWQRLSRTLRHEILQTLAYSQRESKHLAKYAIVCREWQTEIEAVNFSKLVVTQYDLEDLARHLTGRRLGWIKHLWCRIELNPDGGCPEWVLTPLHNQFTMGVLELFRLLERWNCDTFWHGRAEQGLHLELSAFDPTNEPAPFGLDSLDPCYCEDVLLYTFSERALDFPEDALPLPLVDVVAEFSVSLRNHRTISWSAVTRIVSSLRSVEGIRFESWLKDTDLYQKQYEIGEVFLCWPLALRRRSC